MASKAVVDAVLDRLAEKWTQCPVFPARGAASPAQPPADGSPFLLVQFPVASTRRMTLNERRYREEGAFRIVIATRRSLGPDQPAVWVDILASMFRDRRFGAIRTQVPGPPASDEDESLYMRTAFAVPFTHDFTDNG